MKSRHFTIQNNSTLRSVPIALSWFHWASTVITVSFKTFNGEVNLNVIYVMRKKLYTNTNSKERIPILRRSRKIADQQNTLLDKYFTMNPNQVKFDQLMNLARTSQLSKLASFCKIINESVRNNNGIRSL